ncbi:MAG: AAA family ATPase [Chlamydiota bacterium]
MQDLPFSLQSFANIREFNCLYVDKTKYAHDLIVQRQSFFLSRPRRFGKSVFISTLKEILLGKKELFEGLWIARIDYKWPVYGVIHLDFSSINSKDAVTAEASICQSLSNIAMEYGLSVSLSSSSANDALTTLVRTLFLKFKKVAILIDEYDHAILSTLHSPQLPEVLKVVQSFFATVKSLGEYIHFLFITGVSAFAKAGLFSGMSHPEDLSNMPAFACVCGYTEQEIDRYFIPYLENMAKKKSMSLIDLREELKKLYNGYRFVENAPAVYNPFSFIKALRSEKSGNFWFDSGTPTFLIEILKREYAKKNLSIFQMEEFRMSEMEPKYFDVNAIPLPALMLQTGYLTIKSFANGSYTLGFPNLEVQSALQRHMLGILLNLDLNEVSNFANDLGVALACEDIEKITSLLKTLCSYVPSKLHIPKEKFYHALLITTFQSCGIRTLAEHATADGFIDLVLELPNLLYIVEIKFNKSANSALKQIEEKVYYQPFLQNKKPIRLLGINFTRTTQKGKSSHFNVATESKLWTAKS